MPAKAPEKKASSKSTPAKTAKKRGEMEGI
jgi:hypothetical protein